ncbi:hypothetical protein J6590_024474 [Homalodisca vitripennis]|nr:hypothetical protein J6590_024474 [Homalodisca vitripennis]
MHTLHDMHFSTKGKQWLAEQIIKTIQEFALDQSITPMESRQLSSRGRDLKTQEGNDQPPTPETSS